jgi:hypothetical protein
MRYRFSQLCVRCQTAWEHVRIEQRERGAPYRAGQCVELADAVQAADVADGALAVACGLLDGVAQTTILVGLAVHPAHVTPLLVGLVRAHRPARRFIPIVAASARA